METPSVWRGPPRARRQYSERVLQPLDQAIARVGNATVTWRQHLRGPPGKALDAVKQRLVELKGELVALPRSLGVMKGEWRGLAALPRSLGVINGEWRG